MKARPLVPTLAVGDGDYSDSIDVAKRIAMTTGFPFEGGVKNIAKRDGLGIVMLEAVSKIGKLPDHYVQAVGSGTGAVGGMGDGRAVHQGRQVRRAPAEVLHLGQNLPFAPMLHAWEKGSRTLFPEDLNPELISPHHHARAFDPLSCLFGARRRVRCAHRQPAEECTALRTRRYMPAWKMFLKTEGIDIVPASGVAVAVLKDAVRKGTIRKNDTVLLNITGGGEARLQKDKKTYAVMPKFISKNATEKEIEELLCHDLKKSS